MGYLEIYIPKCESIRNVIFIFIQVSLLAYNRN